MKIKQKNLRIFDIVIDNEDNFLTYMEKNIILLQDFFLMLSGNITPKIADYLNEKNICFKEISDCKLKFFSKTNLKNKPDIIYEESKERSCGTLMFDRPIRSGEEIIHEGDITIFARVNSGAKVICEANVEVYGKIDGLVQCDGDYLIIKEIGNGNVIFNGNILDSDQFNGNLKKVLKVGENVQIKDIF